MARLHFNSSRSDFIEQQERFNKQYPPSDHEHWTDSCKQMSRDANRHVADTLQQAYSTGMDLLKDFHKQAGQSVTPPDMESRKQQLSHDMYRSKQAFEKIQPLQMLELLLGQSADPKLTAQRYDNFIGRLRK